MLGYNAKIIHPPHRFRDELAQVAQELVMCTFKLFLGGPIVDPAALLVDHSEVNFGDCRAPLLDSSGFFLA